MHLDQRDFEDHELIDLIVIQIMVMTRVFLTWKWNLGPRVTVFHKQQWSTIVELGVMVCLYLMNSISLMSL